MKKENRNVLGAIIFSSLLLVGCNKVGMNEKKEKKLNDFSIYELPIYSAEIKVIKGGTYPSNYNYDVGVIKFDVNGDGVYSKKDKDYSSKFSLLLPVDKKIMYQLVDKESKFDIFVTPKSVNIKNKKFIYVSSGNKKLSKMNMIVGIKSGDKWLSIIRKPSETYNKKYQNTRKMHELDRIFEETYSRSR